MERAVGGDRGVNLNIPERAAAIDRLDRHGASAYDIAERLGTTPRAVHRRRAERRRAS